jgi:protein tyrosine/serine phosphatase
VILAGARERSLEALPTLGWVVGYGTRWHRRQFDMLPKLYPIAGRWPGNLFLSSRPRGGDWLEDELLGWRRYGIDTAVSLLTDEEEQELDLVGEAAEARKHDLTYVSYPIPDRGVPSDPSTLSKLLETIHRDLQQGKNVLVHCRQGIGRAGLIAASLLVQEGMEPESAIQEVSKARGVHIPETPEQEGCIYGVAANLK